MKYNLPQTDLHFIKYPKKFYIDLGYFLLPISPHHPPSFRMYVHCTYQPIQAPFLRRAAPRRVRMSGPGSMNLSQAYIVFRDEGFKSYVKAGSRTSVSM